MASRNPGPKHVVKPSATAADTASRSIGRDVTQVSVLAVTNDANDCVMQVVTLSCVPLLIVQKRSTVRTVMARRNIFVPIHR